MLLDLFHSALHKYIRRLAKRKKGISLVSVHRLNKGACANSLERFEFHLQKILVSQILWIANEYFHSILIKSIDFEISSQSKNTVNNSK